VSRAQPQRRRRSAEEARRVILEAAQKRLAECGPEEIRLQDIASDVGISHPAILHHFGTREGLMAAVAAHAMQTLNRDLVEAMSGPAVPTALELLAQVRETLDDRGHARLVAWMVLTGRDGGDEDRDPIMLRQLGEALHARRVETARAEGREPASLEDSLFTVMLVASAFFGDALIGSILRRSAGLGDDEDGQRRFDRWFADFLGRPRSG